MSYLHIDNLYKAQEILLFRRCYAMEKIHGTSAHIGWKAGQLRFFSGGENHDRFTKLFDAESLTGKLTEIFGVETDVIVYGEAYGGKCMGMSKTYGPALRFVAFEAMVGDCWLTVPNAADVAQKLGVDFVPYVEIDADLVAIDAERDRDSEQAIKNGMGAGHRREGIVLRPPIEVTLNNDRRVIAKHKREEFAERQTIPDVDPSRREMMERADAIADEWVTAMRLAHVLDGIRAARGGGCLWDVRDTGEVIKAMVEDVCREASGEIVESKAARKAIGHKAAVMFKRYLESQLRGGAAEISA